MLCLCGVLIVVGSTPPTIYAQERSVRVIGSMTDAISLVPIERVSVLYRGSVVTTTDNAGRFATPPLSIEGSQLVLLFQRIGYGPLAQLIQVPPLSTEVHLQLSMEQVPTTLEEIVVEGERVAIRNPGLIGFYNRREEGFGRYVTQAEIDRAQGFDLTSYMRRLRAISVRRCNSLRPLVLYVDGIRFPSPDVVNRAIPPAILGGVEVYMDERVERLPQELIPPGPHCGVMLFWTRDPKGPSPVEVGSHYGARLTGGGATVGFLGGRIVFPLRALPSTLHLQVGFDATLENSIDRWYFSLIPALRPLASISPWYVGTGIVLAKRDFGFGDEVNLEAHHVLMTGLDLPVGPLRPFLELRLLDPARGSGAEVFVFSGVNLRFGER